MPTNWLEWLGVISSVLTIVSFSLYIHELIKRKSQDSLTIGFLHGVKSLADSMASPEATTGDSWKHLVQQINDMLASLRPPPSKIPVMLTLTAISWAASAGSYLVVHNSSEDGVIGMFGFLTFAFLICAAGFSTSTFETWNKEHNQKIQ